MSILSRAKTSLISVLIREKNQRLEAVGGVHCIYVLSVSTVEGNSSTCVHRIGFEPWEPRVDSTELHGGRGFIGVSLGASRCGGGRRGLVGAGSRRKTHIHTWSHSSRAHANQYRIFRAKFASSFRRDVSLGRKCDIQYGHFLACTVRTQCCVSQTHLFTITCVAYLHSEASSLEVADRPCALTLCHSFSPVFSTIPPRSKFDSIDRVA